MVRISGPDPLLAVCNTIGVGPRNANFFLGYIGIGLDGSNIQIGSLGALGITVGPTPTACHTLTCVDVILCLQWTLHDIVLHGGTTSDPCV